MEASTACWTRPSFSALVMRASHSSRRAVVRWSSDSWSALAMVRPSSSRITVRERPRRPAARAAGSPSRPSAPPRRGPSSRPVAPPGGARRPWPAARRRPRRLSRRLGGRVLRLDGLAYRRQAAAEQLLGDRDLLGPQRRQHGVAMHGRRRRHGALAAARTPVTFAGAAAPGSTGPAGTPRRPDHRALAPPASPSGPRRPGRDSRHDGRRARPSPSSSRSRRACPTREPE